MSSFICFVLSFFSFFWFMTSNILSFSFSVYSLLQNFVLYAFVVRHYCSNSRCCSLSLLLIFVVSYFRCCILSLFCTFCYFVLLLSLLSFFQNVLFHTPIVLQLLLFDTFLVFALSVSMFPGTYDPGLYVPRYLCSLPLCY